MRFVGRGGGGGGSVAAVFAVVHGGCGNFPHDFDDDAMAII